MSQTVEDSVGLFHVRCEDVGLDCSYVIFGPSVIKTMNEVIVHMFDCHAIRPEEMTACMRRKISESIRATAPV